MAEKHEDGNTDAPSLSQPAPMPQPPAPQWQRAGASEPYPKTPEGTILRIQHAMVVINRVAAAHFERGETGYAATHVILSPDRYRDVQAFMVDAFSKRREASASGRIETDTDGRKVDVDPSFDPQWPTQVLGLEILVLSLDQHAVPVDFDGSLVGGAYRNADLVAVVTADPRVMLGQMPA